MQTAARQRSHLDRRVLRVIAIVGCLAAASLAIGLRHAPPTDDFALHLRSMPGVILETGEQTSLPASDKTVSPQANSSPIRPSLAARRLDGLYPSEVLRVIDGDTVEMRVSIWLGQEVTTRVRMRGIDAPELRARCEDERIKAEAAKTRLEVLLKTGALYLTEVGYDKYGTRVVARIVDGRSADLGATLVREGLARPYAGGKRLGWCDSGP